MATKWHFYQGMRGEWRWYQLGDSGDIAAASDHAFAELKACMQNAADAGFDGGSFQVHPREPGEEPLAPAVTSALEIRAPRQPR